MKKRIRNFIKRKFYLYDIEDMQSWGHCGCCRKLITDEVFLKVYSWGLCYLCRKE